MFDGICETLAGGHNVLVEGNLIKARAATGWAGELLAMSGKANPYPGKLGAIELGAYADILVVDGNPLEDISVIGGNPK